MRYLFNFLQGCLITAGGMLLTSFAAAAETPAWRIHQIDVLPSGDLIGVCSISPLEPGLFWIYYRSQDAFGMISRGSSPRIIPGSSSSNVMWENSIPFSPEEKQILISDGLETLLEHRLANRKTGPGNTRLKISSPNPPSKALWTAPVYMPGDNVWQKSTGYLYVDLFSETVCHYIPLRFFEQNEKWLAYRISCRWLGIGPFKTCFSQTSYCLIDRAGSLESISVERQSLPFSCYSGLGAWNNQFALIEQPLDDNSPSHFYVSVFQISPFGRIDQIIRSGHPKASTLKPGEISLLVRQNFEWRYEHISLFPNTQLGTELTVTESTVLPKLDVNSHYLMSGNTIVSINTSTGEGKFVQPASAQNLCFNVPEGFEVLLGGEGKTLLFYDSESLTIQIMDFEDNVLSIGHKLNLCERLSSYR